MALLPGPMTEARPECHLRYPLPSTSSQINHVLPILSLKFLSNTSTSLDNPTIILIVINYLSSKYYKCFQAVAAQDWLWFCLFCFVLWRYFVVLIVLPVYCCVINYHTLHSLKQHTVAISQCLWVIITYWVLGFRDSHNTKIKMFHQKAQLGKDPHVVVGRIYFGLLDWEP